MLRARRSSVLGIALSGLLVLAACGDDGDDTAEPADTTAAPEEGGTDDDRRRRRRAARAPSPSTPRTAPTSPSTSRSRARSASARRCRCRVAPRPRRSRRWPRASRTTSTTPTRTSCCPAYTIELTVEDDQFNSNLTTPAVEGLIDNTQVHLFTGMIGTANNQAVRDLLNEECYPQLFANSGSPIWGDVENYPWTTGALTPYNTETAVYVEDIDGSVPRRRDGGGVPREQRVRRRLPGSVRRAGA